MKKLLAILTSGSLALVGSSYPAQADTHITIKELALIDSGSGDGGAEIPSYHSGSQNIYTTNGTNNSIDVYSIADPENPVKIRSIDMNSYGDSITSVAAGKNVVAVAVHNEESFAADGTPTLNTGSLVVFYPSGAYINSIDLGAVLPDSVTFTPDGMTALVAIEGEPICAADNPATAVDESLDYSLAKDPKGAVAIVDLTNPRTAKSRLAGFSQFKASDLRKAGVVLSLTATNPAVDLEPEYVSAVDNDFAYVSLQEANAIGVVDIKNAKITRIFSAGTVDRSVVGFDSSDRDELAGKRTYDNVKGLAMPDTLAAFQVGSDNYFVSANEGDDRADWTCFTAVDDVRAKDLTVDASVFTDWDVTGSNAELGRAKANPNIGDSDGDGEYERLFLLGSRSFSIFKNNKRIYDSEDLIADLQIENFGIENMNSQWDRDGSLSKQNRSDDKGAEPEGAAVGMVGDVRVAVIGMERMSALLFMDITDPAAPTVISWEQMMPVRDLDPETEMKRWSPEGMVFIDASESPNGKTLLVTSFEVSGTLTIHQLD